VARALGITMGTDNKPASIGVSRACRGQGLADVPQPRPQGWRTHRQQGMQLRSQGGRAAITHPCRVSISQAASRPVSTCAAFLFRMGIHTCKVSAVSGEVSLAVAHCMYRQTSLAVAHCVSGQLDQAKRCHQSIHPMQLRPLNEVAAQPSRPTLRTNVDQLVFSAMHSVSPSAVTRHAKAAAGAQPCLPLPPVPASHTRS